MIRSSLIFAKSIRSIRTNFIHNSKKMAEAGPVYQSIQKKVNNLKIKYSNILSYTL